MIKCLILAFLIISCGEKQPPGEARLRIGGSEALMASLDDGVMVYTVNTADASTKGAFQLNSSSEGLTIDVPVGDYQLTAIGFNSTSPELRCGTPKHFSISADQTTNVDLSMTSLECVTNRVFAPSDVISGSVPNFALTLCNGSLGGVSGYNSTCTGPSSGSARLGYEPYQTFDSGAILGTQVYSPCTTLSGGVFTNYAYIIPGNDDFSEGSDTSEFSALASLFNVNIYYYDGVSDCSGASSKAWNFASGLSFQEDTSTAKSYHDASNTGVKLFLVYP